jgi:hypothetical protein
MLAREEMLRKLHARDEFYRRRAAKSWRMRSILSSMTFSPSVIINVPPQEGIADL